MIPPKLFQMAESVLFQRFSTAINNSSSKELFLDDAKIALVLPLDKRTFKKNDISNFRQASILTTFSKIHEKITNFFDTKF